MTLERETKLRAALTAACGLMLVMSIACFESTRQERNRQIAEAKRELCYMRHARDLAVLGDSLVDRRMMFSDFAEIWRDTRREFQRDCAERPT